MAETLESLTAALREVKENRGDGLRNALLGTFAVVAAEAARNETFAAALVSAWGLDAVHSGPPRQGTTVRRPTSGRKRAAPVLDPFAVYAEVHEEGLRRRLSALSDLQLRDIIAYEGMDYDKRAMKMRSVAPLVDRIVERVVTRESKGSALR